MSQAGPQDSPGIGKRSAFREMDAAAALSASHMNEPAPSFLAGGGEMGALMRAFDWTKTPIGPVETWSRTLRMMVSFLLANRFPLLLWWGPQYASIYNDAYRPILGNKHPRSMGQPASECWSEIWHILSPLIDTPFNGGPSTWMEDIFLEVNRHGFVEETHFTIAYSPVPDESAPRGVGGVLAAVHETTEKVIGERRIVALRDLGARAPEAKSAEEACAIAASTLANHAKDIPFTLVYLFDPGGARARLAGVAGLDMGEAASPLVIELDQNDTLAAGWPLAQAVHSEAMVTVDELATPLRQRAARSVVRSAALRRGGAVAVEQSAPAGGVADCRGEPAHASR